MANLDDFGKDINKKKKSPESPAVKTEFKQSAPAKKADKIRGRKQQTNFFVRFALAAFPQATDTTNEKLRKAFLLLAVAVLIGSLLFLGWQIFGISKAGNENSSLAEIAGSPMEQLPAYSVPSQINNPIMTVITSAGDEEPEYIDLTPVVNVPLEINWGELQAQNPDTRAWIKITGTGVNNPVVVGKDNSYYLEHSFTGEESIAGTVFSTYKNKWDGSDDNIVLFGHNMASGDMFAWVNHYVPKDTSREPVAFYKVHPTVMLATPDGGCQTYKVFAGMVANTEPKYGEVFDYMSKTKFNSADDFNKYIIEVMDRSWFFTDVDLTYGDELLTLSTCWWPLGRDIETRWVVFARKVRPGESEYVDTSKAFRNYQAELFDYYYDVIGGEWYGSVWDRSKLLSY